MARFKGEAKVIQATERFMTHRPVDAGTTLSLGEAAIFRIYGNGDINRPTPGASRERATLLTEMLADETNGLSEARRAEVRAMIEETI